MKQIELSSIFLISYELILILIVSYTYRWAEMVREGLDDGGYLTALLRTTIPKHYNTQSIIMWIQLNLLIENRDPSFFRKIKLLVQ